MNEKQNAWMEIYKKLKPLEECTEDLKISVWQFSSSAVD